MDLQFQEWGWREAMAKRKIRTIQEVARRAGMSFSRVWQISKGLVPPPETRERIAAALGCQVADIWRPVQLVSGEVQADGVAG